MHNISLFLTEHCNQKCDYCDIPDIQNPQHYNPKLWSLFINKILSFNHNIVLSGGEPGLLSEDQLYFIFKSFNNIQVDVNTNGLFLEKNYHKTFSKYIKKINHHLIHTNSKTYTDLRISTNSIITKNNFNQYNNNSTLIIPKNNNLNLIPTGEQISSIYNKNIYKINQKYLRTLKCSVATRSINFVRGTIHQCCKSISLSPSVPLSNENLQIYLNSKYSDTFFSCKYCTKFFENINSSILFTLQKSKRSS